MSSSSLHPESHLGLSAAPTLNSQPYLDGTKGLTAGDRWESRILFLNSSRSAGSVGRGAQA
jgi:hypothetical protein